MNNTTSKEGFRISLFKRRANAIKIFMLLSLVALFYHQDLMIVGNEALKSEITSYILAIPFLLVYIIYRKRKVLRAAMHLQKQRRNMKLDSDHIVGFALCLSSILLYVYGSYTFHALQWHMLSLPLFVSGCVLFMFNYKLFRESAFPIVFLLLLMPLPLDIFQEIGTEISLSTLVFSYNILKAFNLPVSLQFENAIITTHNPAGETTSFMIGIPCGGIYAIMGFLVFAIFASYITRGVSWKKGALFFTGFLLIYSLNILRVVVTVSMSYFLNSRVGLDLFHMLGGPTLIFLASTILLFIGQKAFNLEIATRRDKRKDHVCRGLTKNPNESFCYMCGKHLKSLSTGLSKVDLMKFLAVLTLVSLVTSAQLSAFALEGSSLEIDSRNPVGEERTQQFLPPMEGYEPEFISRDRYFENITDQDASLVFAYLPKEEGKTITWVTVEIADAISKIHTWDICLLHWQRRIGKENVDVIELKDVQLLEFPPLVGRLFVFNQKKSTSTVFIIYWFEKAVFNVASNWESRYIKTSLIVYSEDLIKSGEIKGVGEYPKVESKLLSMATDIAVYWGPVKTWSIFTPLFASWAPVIIFSVIIFSVFVKMILEMHERKDRAKVYKRIKLSSRFIEKDKNVLLMVEILRKHGKATGKEIFELYKKVSKESTDLNEFLDLLKYAENEGVIERDIENSRDEGLLVWKTAVVPRPHARSAIAMVKVNISRVRVFLFAITVSAVVWFLLWFAYDVAEIWRNLKSVTYQNLAIAICLIVFLLVGGIKQLSKALKKK